MCGIAGIFNLDQTQVDSHAIRRMNDIAHHRGPDDEGFVLIQTETGQIQQLLGEKSDALLLGSHPQISNYNNDFANLALAFKRLAIVDLSIAGHQPMTDESGQYWMIFNGEIYNYLELKKELETLGVQFKTTGDSEVLLQSYIHWGEECVKKFIGMFAVIIWDVKRKELFGARDRFGVKPLCYFFDGNKFIWSSEEKQIIASREVNLEYNQNSISRFFLRNQLHEGEETFLSGIKNILPGHYFKIKNKQLAITKYWDINPEIDNSGMSESERIARFNTLFTDAVRLRLRSDVPIGIALSGGLDSSSIAMVSKSILSNHVKTFSVYYDHDKKYDEREFIQEVLDTGGFDPMFYTQDEQINLQAIQNWIFHQDGPTTGASPYSAYLNYKNVRNSGIIVLLNGQGGDEILAGYPYYFKYFIADQIKQLKFSGLFSNLNQWRKDQNLNFALKHLGGGILSLILNHDAMLELENKKYSSPELYQNTDFKIESPGFNNQFKTKLNQSLYETLRMRMLPHLLHWEDRNSMACSIESRVPFLDHRLVEFMFSLPNDSKIRNGTTKAILRDALKDVLPKKILNRRDKKGFGTPTDLWTSGIFKNEIQDLISSQSMKERGLWNMDKLSSAMEKNQFGENELWKIISTELFMREFELINARVN
ncbi:MAG: asparagine synthase (glutamine-hydrolyzing) [Saprospiraceae bacterium]